MLNKPGPNMLGLVLIVLTATSFATTEEVKCRSGCGGVVPQTFKFAEGTTYHYNFEGVLDVSLSNSKGQKSETKVKATVLLTQQAECNQILRIQNLQITGDQKKFGSLVDIEKPIRLNYHDGHLEDIICAENGDTQNSLNVKRAIASMFQAALKHHNTEIDIFGSCPTEFSQHKDGAVVVIKKARNLNKCAHRESIGQDYISLTYDLTSDIKTSPILQGIYNAEMRLKNGILDTSVVNEDYLYVPFSVGDEGAKVNVRSKLAYVKQSKEAVKASCSVPKTIIFENPHLTVAEKSVSKALTDAIKDAANAIDLTLTQNSAEKFSKVVGLMRKAKKDEIITIYSQVRSGAGFKPTARRIFMDALFRAGTGESIEAAIEMYKNNELTDLESKLFFLRLSFVKHPTVGAIKGGVELLSKNLPREATIGLGALVGKYCQQHPCNNIPVLDEFLNTLAKKLNKPNNRETEEQVMASLKAISNAGRTNPTVDGKLTELAQDKNGASRIRSATLDAYKANSCNDRLRDSALNILNDIQQDSELRIKAYLAVAKCPNGKVATNIKNLLDKEESYQVGGFIVSHLQTLRTSTNPDKAQAKSQLENIRTTKKFPVDWFRFSRNLEVSDRWDTVGLGGSVEANIIYSKESIFPRSTQLNMTTQLFGHTFNFLEIDTWQENLEDVAAKYFGPMGLFRKDSPNQLFKDGQGAVKKITEKVNERIHKNIVKREASKSQIETFSKSINRKENELNRDLELDMSIKMFGTEVLFLSISEDITKYTPEALVDKIFDKIDQVLNKMKGFDENFNSNIIFLDSDISYPTSVGFPLRLSVDGVASMNLKTSGKLDLGRILGKKDGEYKLSLIPSADIQVTSRMVVVTPTCQRGLRLTGNLFTATGETVEITLSPSNVDVKYSLPVKKQDLITATHEIVFETVENDGQSTKVALQQTKSKDVTVCLDQLQPYLGVTICAHVNQPNVLNDKVILPYPLNGNSKLSVTIDNSDLGYVHFTGKMFDQAEGGSLKTGIELETKAICTKNKVKSSLKTEVFLRPEIYFLTTFNSEKKKASAELRAVMTQQEYSVFARATMDQIEYYAKIGGFVSGAPPKEIFKPIMEYKAGTGKVEKMPYRLEGQIVRETQGEISKYKLENLQVVGLPKPIKINGNIVRTLFSLEPDISFTDGEKNGKLKGKAQYKDQQLNLHAMLENNINPNANFEIKYDLKTGENLIDSNLHFQHGDFAKKENIFKLQNMFKRSSPKDPLPFETKNKLTYPKLGLDNEFDLKLTDKSIDTELKIAYQKTQVKVELDAVVNKKKFGDYDVEFKFNGMNNKLELNVEREIDGPKSKIKNSLEVNGKTIKLDGDITDNSESNKIDFGTNLKFKVTGFTHDCDLKIVSSLKANPQDTDGSLTVSDGGKVIIESFIKANKGGNANGSLKVNSKAVTMQGQLKSTKFSGTSDLTVDIPNVRKIKLQTTFNAKLPTFNFEGTLLTNADKDASRKYVFSTANEIKEASIDSKNSLEILGKKTTFNIKGTNAGDIRNGKTNGQFDLTLPNDLYFAGKLNRERKEVKDVANGKMYLELEQRDNKNAPGRKISIKGEGKNVDPQNEIYDIVYNIVLENGNGKNLNVDLDFKGNKQGDKRVINWSSNVQGAALSEPMKAKFGLILEKHSGEITINFNGAQSVLNLNGKLDHHHHDESGKPCTVSADVELKTPYEHLKLFKLNTDAKITIPSQKSKQFEFLNNFKMMLNDGVDVKIKNDWKLGREKGKMITNYNLKGDKNPTDIDLSYDTQKHTYKGVVKSNNNINFDITFDVLSQEEVHMDAKLKTDFETLKNLNVDWKYKFNRETKVVDDNVKVNFNGKDYETTSSIGLSEHYPLLSIEFKYPDGNIDKLHTKFNNVGVRSISAETIIKLHKIPFNFNGNVDVHAESIEDFDLKLELDSPELKINKILITANTKETKGTNKLIVTVKENNQNLLSGNAVYKTRSEDDKFVIEGSGTFTIKNEKKSGNFKYTKTNLNTQKHNEDGVEFALRGSIGEKALDSEIKITDKHRRALLSFCEQKKDCANIEMDAKYSNVEGEGRKHTLEMNVDLRKLGLSHEFGMNAITKINKWNVDHTVDLHFQNQQSKYSYNLYVHPKSSGWSVTTPNRILCLESSITRPDLGDKGPIKGEVLFYLNKKTKPNEKSGLFFTINPEFSDKLSNLDAEIKFIHPALKKPMLASYKSKLNLQTHNLEIQTTWDVIPNSNKKVSADIKGSLQTDPPGKMELKHTFIFDLQPLKLKINGEWFQLIDLKNKILESKFNMNLNGKKCENSFHSSYKPGVYLESLKINNFVIYDWESDWKTTPEGGNSNLNLQIIGLEKLLAHFEFKKLESAKFYLTNAAKNPKLEIDSAFIPNQLADFRVNLQKDGKKINFFHGNVKLDDKEFLKTDYGFDTKHVKEHFVEPAKKTTQKVIESSKNAIKKSTEDVKNYASEVAKAMKENDANIKPIMDYYQNELQTIRTELEKDETIKKLNEALVVFVQAWIDFINSLNQIGAKFTTDMNEIIQKYIKTISESLEKEILPKYKEIIDKLTDATYQFIEKSNEIIFGLFEQMAAYVEAHKEELKQIASVISSTTQDIHRFVIKVAGEIKQTFEKEWHKILEEVKALPYYNELKMIIEKIRAGEPVPQEYIDQFQGIINEIQTQIHIPPVKEIIDYASKYLIKKMKREQVNDVEELKHIAKMIAETIKELMKNEGLNEEYGQYTPRAPLMSRLLSLLPKLVAGRSSIINRILGGDTAGIEELIMDFTLNPMSLMPPYRRYAITAQGQHIFTFDGQHLTFPGKCNYILATDYNNEFTISGTYTNGIMTELTFFDKTDTFTLKKNGMVTFNAASTELPVRTKTTDVFKLYTHVQIESRRGVRIFCSPDLTLCIYSVSGFYHDRLRGLLGNPNFEKYDDFILPSGKVTESESEFGNAYKVQTECPNVKTVDHGTHNHNEECTKLFTETSTLSSCFPFVKPDLFRQACDHGMAAKVPNTAEAIVRAYQATCTSRFVPTLLPKEFVKCTNSEKPFSLGDKFSVKTPQKSADIVFVIDVTTQNKQIYTDLVTPLGEQLKKELSDRGVKDVEFHIITYGGDQPEYPSHITTGGGKLTFKGKLPNLKFSDPIEEEDDIETGNKQIDFMISFIKGKWNEIKGIFIDTPEEAAYSEAVKYPFRAQAVGGIVVVTSKACNTDMLVVEKLMNDLLPGTSNAHLSVNVFTPMNAAFKVKDDKTTKNVIGFNKNYVMTYPDCKKKALGNADLVKEISHTDFCSKFTAWSGGNVFVLDNFSSQNKGNKKFFGQVAAYNIAENMLETEYHLDCECTREDLTLARNTCDVVESKKRPPSEKKITRG